MREEKRKLEEYLKKSLSSFKDRFKLNLDTLKKDKLAQEEKIRLLTEKLEANQETARREERLLLSSMYEVTICVCAYVSNPPALTCFDFFIYLLGRSLVGYEDHGQKFPSANDGLE